MVDLHSNDLTELPNFCHLSLTLAILDLSLNKIVHLGSLLECGLPALYQLFLTGNSIHHLGLTCEIRLMFWPRMMNLKVDDNQLTELPGLYCEDSGRLENVSSTISVWAQGNPYQCNSVASAQV